MAAPTPSSWAFSSDGGWTNETRTPAFFKTDQERFLRFAAYRVEHNVRSTSPNGRPSTRYGSASAALARQVAVETACLTSNVLASWVTRLPIEPPMAGARTVSQAEILPRATLANDLDLRSATIYE